ncbi:MAG: DUF5666 domain-containing protein [Terriglobales bacterium]
MKKLLGMFAILTFSVFAFAQDAPKQDAPKTEGEGRPRGEGRMQMRGPGTAGTITAIEGQTITLKTLNGGTATVKLTDQTRFNKERQPAKLADFKVGDSVVVRGEEAGANTYTATMVATAGGGMMQMMSEGMGKQFIAGKVEKIDELKLTIARVDGQTQVIEVDENTSFRKQGESITLADIKVGDDVMGRGALKAGIFVPATLNVGFPGGMRMIAPGGNPPAEKKPDPK